MGLIEKDQIVETQETGMDRLHSIADAIAAEQKTRADLIHRRTQNGRLYRRPRPVVLSRCTTQATDQQRPLVLPGQPAQRFRYPRYDSVARLG